MENDLEDSAETAIIIHDESAFVAMRAAGRLAAATLDYITPFVVPGVVTAELDQLCHDYICQHGAIPAPLGYRGYPKSTCISPNHVVCHGIPSEKTLEDGDIVNIDVTVILNGWYGDTSRMYLVGDNIPLKGRKLVQVTYEALMRGVAAARPGRTLGDVGAAIQAHAEANYFSVVRDFCGHGIGQSFHAPPSVLHYGRAGAGVVLKPGMFFTIEPMINAGRYEVKILSDGWTAITRDRSLSAQFEHTIGITNDGAEIFTLSPAGHTLPPYTA